MLEVFLFCVISSFLLELISKPLVSKIKNASSTEKILLYRNQLRWLRWGLIFVLLSLYFGISVYFNQDIDFWINGGGKYSIVCFLYYFIYEYGFEKMFGNITTTDKNTFLKKNSKYTLYLRGFKDDKYGAENMEIVPSDGFSEFHLMKNIRKYMPICALGMTKEIDAPFGATRVYVDDVNWKGDILELINHAEHIIILINDSPNCIWEIDQCRNFLQKTSFLIYNRETYETVKRKLEGIIPFPDIMALQFEHSMALRFINKTEKNINDDINDSNKNQLVVSIHEIKNSDNGFEEAASFIINGRVEHKMHLARKLCGIIYSIIGIILLFSINFSISNYLLDTFETESTTLLCIVIGVLIAIELLIYMRIRLSVKSSKNS